MALDPEIQAQQDALRDEIAALAFAVRQQAGVLGGMTGSIRRATNELNQVKIEEDFAKLNRNVKSNNLSLSEATNQLIQLDRAAAESGNALSAQATANREAILANLRAQVGAKAVADGFQVVATVVGGFVVESLKAFASELTKGSGAVGYFNLGQKLMTNNILSTSKAISGFGSIAESTGQILALAARTPAGMIAGAVVSIFGAVAKSVGERAAEAAKFGLEILNDQVQQLLVTFQTYSNAGAVFANGLADLGNIAKDSGVSIKTIGAFVAKTAEQMVMFGGTVSGGAALIGKVNRQFVALDAQGNSFRKQLGNLGLSIEDQMSITADYLEMLARGGRLRGKQDAEIAREAFEYAKSLKTITSITGEEAKAAQRRAKQAFEQSYVQARIGQLGTEAAAKFKLGVAGMPAELQKAVQQMATEGVITDPELAAAVAQVPALQEMLTRIASGITDQSRSVTDFTADLTELRASLGPVAKEQVLTAAQGVGKANLLLGKFAGIESVFQAVLNLGTAAKEGGEAQTKAQTVVEAAAKVTDKLTQVIGSAETEFENLKISLETSLRPAIENYAKFIQDQISTTGAAIQGILRYFGIIEGSPLLQERSVAGTVTVTEGGAATAVQRDITRYVSPESLEGQRRMRLGLPLAPENPQDRRLREGTQTTPGAIETPRPVSSLNDPVVVAMTQTNQKLEELIEQNRELIRLNTQTARALA